MSIDRIRAPKPPGATVEAPAGPAGTRSGADFRVARSGRTIEAMAPTAPGPLARLRAGEVDAAGYIELHVHQATAHLSWLGPEHLQQIQEDLRERCDCDPLLRELVARATG
jgi:hypothetical protein